MKSKNPPPLHMDGSRKPRLPGLGNGGFTLLELVLATLISAMVIGIFSVALTLSLRIWERQQTREYSNAPALIDLLKWQLAEFDPVQVKWDGKNRFVFFGEEHALTFVTGHSVRAISKGAPVVARYVSIPTRGELYYAELPFDPYHSERLQEFLQLNPAKGETSPRFYVTEIDDFSLSYVSEDAKGSESSWDEGNALPIAVLVNYRIKGHTEALSTLIIPSFFFAKKVENAEEAKINRTKKTSRKTRK
jgi:hypothetical protein